LRDRDRVVAYAHIVSHMRRDTHGRSESRRPRMKVPVLFVTISLLHGLVRSMPASLFHVSANAASPFRRNLGRIESASAVSGIASPRRIADETMSDARLIEDRLQHRLQLFPP
jgi:hypothetical protein